MIPFAILIGCNVILGINILSWVCNLASEQLQDYHKKRRHLEFDKEDKRRRLEYQEQQKLRDAEEEPYRIGRGSRF